MLCYVTIFCCLRFHYSVRAVKDGEKKEGKFIKLYIYIYIYIYIHTHTHTHIHTHTGCPRRNVPDLGRVFLMLKYTDITQNTYVQS